MVKWTLQNSPALMITLYVGLVILGSLSGSLWSLILTQFGTIGALANFTFSSLISNTSTALSVILLSVALVSAVLAVLGYKISTGMGRSGR